MEWKNQIEQNKVSFFKDLQSLIQIQSLRNDEEKTQNAPFGKGCREALDFMLALGKKEGFDVQDIDGYAGVISYGNQNESIGVLGHLDVVPAGDGWDSDPFDLIEKDGILFGRGVLDDKGPGLAAFYALKMIKDLNIKLNKKIMLIYGCDEESKMECMKYYIKHGEIPNMGFVPDADFPVIYGEKGILNLKVSVPLTKAIPCNLQAGERFNVVIGGACATCRDFTDEMQALFHFYLQTNQLKGEVTVCNQEAKLQMEGVFAHAATPYLGENAGLHMINFLSNVYKNPELKALYENFKDWQGQPLDIFMNSTHMGFLTLNVGKINLQSNHIDLYLDIRYPHECEVEQILSKIQSKVQKYCKRASIEIIENSSPLFVDPKSELITTLMDVYQSFTGDYTSVPKTMGGGTYARKLPNFVAFGPEFPTSIKNDKIGNPHQKNEGVVFDDLLKSIAIYAESMKRLGS